MFVEILEDALSSGGMKKPTITRIIDVKDMTCSLS